MNARTRLLIASALSLITVVLAYPIARVGEQLAFGTPNPAAVVASNRIALYWRTGIVVVLCVALFPLFYELTKRPAWMVERLPWYIGVASAALLLQSALVP